MIKYFLLTLVLTLITSGVYFFLLQKTKPQHIEITIQKDNTLHSGYTYHNEDNEHVPISITDLTNSGLDSLITNSDEPITVTGTWTTALKTVENTTHVDVPNFTVFTVVGYKTKGDIK